MRWRYRDKSPKLVELGEALGQETGTANSVKVTRGFIGVSYSGEYVPSPTAVTRGWRPVLELVE